MPVKNAGAQLLHVPNKSWVGVEAPTVTQTPSNQPREEKQNYDELERWSNRIPRGLIAYNATFSPSAEIIVGQTTDILQTNPPVQMELGRVYKTSAQWPGLQPVATGDQVGIRIWYNAISGGVSGYSGYIYLAAPFSGGVMLGGNLFSFVVPQRVGTGVGSPGLYQVHLVADLSSGTGMSMWGSSSAPIVIATEDLGMYNGAHP